MKKISLVALVLLSSPLFGMRRVVGRAANQVRAMSHHRENKNHAERFHPAGAELPGSKTVVEQAYIAQLNDTNPTFDYPEFARKHRQGRVLEDAFYAATILDVLTREEAARADRTTGENYYTQKARPEMAYQDILNARRVCVRILKEFGQSHDE